MKRNQLVFFAIIGLAVAIIGVGFGLQAIAGLGGDSTEENDDPVNQVDRSTINLTVAVNPLLESWVTDAAQRYNATNPQTNGRPIRVTVRRQDSLAVWGENTVHWSSTDHPQVWIPEAGYALTFAQDGFRLNYKAEKASLGQTPIIWGAYQNYGNVIVNNAGALNSTTIQQAAATASWEDMGGNSRWGFIKLAFSRPDSTDPGLASLLTLIGNLGGNTKLTSDILSNTAMLDQLRPVIDAVPNFSTLGLNPASVMATRGTSTGEIGLLPESQWLANFAALSAVEPVQLYYTDAYILLNFPYAIWDGIETTSAERQAAQAFGNYLMADNQQALLGAAGFRPATRSDVSQFAPFQAAQGLVQLELSGNEITPADRSATLALLRWFKNLRPAS